jgi:hypothetical protein
VQRLASGDEKEERAQKVEISPRLTQPNLFNLLLDDSDDQFQKVLPTGAFQIRGKFTRNEP